MKKFRCILVVGTTGTGKSHFVKNTIVKNYKGPKYIYDINNEYKDGVIMDFSKFLQAVKPVRRSLIIFEEATIFLSNKGDSKELREILVAKRHRDNTVVLVFHSLRAIPTYIFDLSDLLVLFRTTDNWNLISRKLDAFVDVLDAFVEIKEKGRKFARKLVYLRA